MLQQHLVKANLNKQQRQYKSLQMIYRFNSDRHHFKVKTLYWCEMCGKSVSEEEYDFCDICPDCRDGD